MHFDFHERFDLNEPNKNVFECTPIRFCFVGPRGVGKSSLLASMYHQIHAKGISIEPSGYRTQHVLKEALKDMQEMINDTPMGHTVEESIGLQGSQEAAHYEFTGKQIVRDNDLIKRSDFKEFIFSFRFVDIPGGWFIPQHEKFSESLQLLLQSIVSFIAVDAPALMAGAATAQRNNQPDIIRDWYRCSLAQLKSMGHTVIFVLTRCEKYWNDKSAMRRELEKTYASLIQVLKKEGIKICITWVKTLGGLEFDHYEKGYDSCGNRIRKARFKRVGDYAPENCATPLELGLENSLKSAALAINKSVNNNFLPWLTSTIGLSNEHLAIQAANKLARKLKHNMLSGVRSTYEVI